MDGKKQIRINSAQGDEVENIDLSIGYDAACSIYVVLGKGLAQTAQDINSMVAAHSQMKPEDAGREQLGMEAKIAKVAFDYSKAFYKEVARVIKELESEKNEPKKVIIHKPNWNGGLQT